MPQAIEKAIAQAYPEHDRFFTYFVNSINKNDKSCPYSFVSSTDIDPKLKSGEIIINEWLAEDLKAEIGDDVDLTYYTISKLRNLEEKTTSFTVKSIVPIKDWAADRTLTPQFPGLSDSENCSDWDPGLPVDTKKIRDKDEEYWDQYNTIPKAFISVDTARVLWGNRFGQLTAIRIDSGTSSEEDISSSILSKLNPAELNISFVSVKAKGLYESRSGVDFSGLFIGLSFFIVASALMIMGMLFTFNIQTRSSETAVMRTMGFTPSLRTLILKEGTILVIIGSIAGASLGSLYSKTVIYALTSTDWQGAVNAASLKPYFSISTLITGAVITSIVAICLMWWLVRRQQLKTIRSLFSTVEQLTNTSSPKALVCSVILLSLAVICALISDPTSGKASAGTFYASGSLTLIGLITLTNGFFINLHKTLKKRTFSKLALAGLSVTRRRKRSLTSIGSIACGIFLIIAVAANQHGLESDPAKHSTGTGGFAYYGESSIPVFHDLNSQRGRKFYGLNESFNNSSFVQASVKGGDDASCLNLNRVLTPELVGIPSEQLDSRSAFSFASTTDIVDELHPWLVLNKTLDETGMDIIPAVADMAVIQWGLGKSIGDDIEYIDEYGKPFKVRLVAGLKNSIFQGSLIISQKNLIKHYPSLGGSKIILVDHNDDNNAPDLDHLRERFEDIGLNLTPTAERLAMFSEIENTYLRIFLALGGLGIIIGTAGLGIVVLRTVLERRSELAAMRAIGYTKQSIINLILVEHILLLGTGVIIGVIAAVIAVLPSLISSGSTLPVMNLIVFILGIITVGITCIRATTHVALYGPLLKNLRSE